MQQSTEPALSPRRVMVIGFDGATLDLIRPWAEAGLLPHFKRLMEQGAWGPLESTMPPVTPAAWSSLATGTNQGKHGLFDFYAKKPNSYETYVVNANDRRGATLWGLLGEAGYRVTVFNIPATYPPDDVNGTMVSGFLTPAQATDASRPREALSELKKAVPDFGFYPPAIFSRGQEIRFVQDVLQWDRTALHAADWLREREPWDFNFAVFTGVDIMSHWMWRPMATQGESVDHADPHVRQVLAGAIQSAYRQADEILGRLLEAAGEETFVMVVSDHGFGPLDYYMHLNTWLYQHGHLCFKRSPLVRLKEAAFRLGFTPQNMLLLLRGLHLGETVQQVASTRKSFLNAAIKKAFLSFGDVDWAHTRAYTAGYGGPIFLNLKGREPQGIVEPGAEAEAALAQITADLRALRDPITGEPFVGEIYRPARDLYQGPYTELAPDLMFVPRNWSTMGFGLHDFACNRWLEPTPDRTGTHRMQGIFFLRGPGIPNGRSVQGARLIDLAPTILALMGVPIPTEMDGQVLTGALGEALPSSLAPTFRQLDSRLAEAKTGSVFDEEEERIVRERLEALGYFG